MASRRPTFVLLSFLFIPLIISCASSRPAQKETVPAGSKVREMETSRQIREMNEKILTSLLSSKKNLNRDYKIGPEDLIEISVFEDEKLNKTVRVSSQGNINLPLIGTLRVKGLTSSELEKEVRDLLAEKYFQDPNVSVLIKEYRNQQVSVLGAVQKTGIFDFNGQKTILDLLAVVGGLRDDAGPLLFLFRQPKKEEASKLETVPDEQKADTFVINLEELLIDGNFNLNLPLINGDIINVPVGGKVFVGGEVRSPGGYQKGKQLTLGQAIMVAGGLKWEADGAEARVLRIAEKRSEKEILTFDVYAIQEGKAEDPYLKENDIIFVPKHGFRAFLSVFKDILNIGIGYGGFSAGM